MSRIKLISAAALAAFAGVVLADALLGHLGSAFGEIQSLLQARVAGSPDVVALSPMERREETVKIILVGDIMLSRGVARSVAKNYAGDWSKFLRGAEFLRSADIAFGNLEGPVSTRGADGGGKFSFRMEPVALEALALAGVDVVSGANNHIGDFGRVAFEDTLAHAREFGVRVAGAGLSRAEAETPRTFGLKGEKIGFLAFSDVGPKWLEASRGRSGILLTGSPDFEKIIRKAAGAVDVLIVGFHWGEEYKERVGGRQRELARLAVDAGAALVVGHHPHLPQEVELYRNAPIFYSLGNFIFDQNFSKETMRGEVAEVILKRGRVHAWRTQKVVLDKTFRPSLVETGE